MQIVIEIDEKEYERAMKRKDKFPRDLTRFENIITNGTPLPKGHGDLVDRSQALRTDCFGDGHDGLRAFHEYGDYAKMRKYLQHIPTIIPADKEGEENENNTCTG